MRLIAAICRSAVLVIAVLAFSANALFARIGETEQQIEARYGKGRFTLSIDYQLFYQSSGINIVVTFIDGVSQSEFFKNQDNSELSKNEIGLLLEVNAAGSKWIEDPNARLAGVQGWKLQSGGRHAAYSLAQRSLLIQTDIADKDFAEGQAEVAKEKLKGF
jgi:hypothetical protein